jgi:hypothetical protein
MIMNRQERNGSKTGNPLYSCCCFRQLAKRLAAETNSVGGEYVRLDDLGLLVSIARRP